MAIVRFDPFEDMARLFEDIGYSGVRQGVELASARTWAPAVDIFEDGEEIVVHAELPGMKQDDIDIELSGDTLTIKGERKFTDTQRKDKYVRVERAYGHFQRSFTVGVPVQHEAVRASYRDGLLEVHLPKSPETKPKKVQVTAE